jgi:DNA-directed RNA polymerase subunit RPC12/RpoP
MDNSSCYCNAVQFFGHLLGTVYQGEIPNMFGRGLQYFCMECGNELVNRTLIDISGCHSFQECPKCSYTLLFGTVKKKLKERRCNGNQNVIQATQVD